MAYIPPFGAGDAVCARTLSDLKVFTDWLTTNSMAAGRGIITEVGIPGSSNPGVDPLPGGTETYDPNWENVMQQWYEGANRSNLHVSAWNAAEWGIGLRAYRTDDGNNKPLNYRTTVSSVIENNPGNATYLRGVAYAGADFSDGGPNGSLNRSHLSQPNAGYYYPSAGSFTTLFARGIVLIRLPVRWERLQPTLKQPLDTTEMAALAASINAAGAAGCKVLLDIHNYARYDTTPTGANANGVYQLGQNAPATHNGQTVGGTMTSCFTDFWSRVATYFNGNTAIWGYDIMNEPHDLPAGVSDWVTASQAAVEAIRLVNQTVKIAVEGYQYASVPNWTSLNGGTAWLTETIPVGQTGAGSARNTDVNVLWCGHHYFDTMPNGHDGSYRSAGNGGGYANELSSATGAGFATYATGGYTAPVTNNTSQTGTRTTFKSTFASASDFSGTNDAVVQGSNTVTVPYTAAGSSQTSLRVVSSSTSDEGGIRKNLPTSLNSRIIQFDHTFDVGTTLSLSADFAISHMWDNTFVADLLEVRAIGSGAGYKLIMNTAAGALKTTGGTVFTFGTTYTLKVVVTDTDFKLYVNGSGTAEVTITTTNTGKNVGGIALGKFYGTQVLSMNYNNFSTGVTATYYAPPNGGLMAAAQTLPTITITGSSTSAFAPATVNLSSVPTATTAGATVTKVDFFDGITLVGTDTVAPWTFSVTNVPAGVHSYTSKVTDSNGLSATSSPVSITVAANTGGPPADVPPTITINLSAASGTAPAGLTITATPADSDGTINLVEFYNGGAKIGQVTAAPWTFVVSGLQPGTYTFTAKATDNSGSSTISPSKTFVSNVGAGTPPVVTLSAAVNTATAPGSVTLTSTATDASSTITRVEFFAGASKVGEVDTGPFVLVLTGIPAGTYNYVALATDGNGLQTTSTPFQIVINSVITVIVPVEVQIQTDNTSGTLLDIKMFVEGVLGNSDGNVPDQIRDGLINDARDHYYRSRRWSFLLRPHFHIVLTQNADIPTLYSGPLPLDRNKSYDLKQVYDDYGRIFRKMDIDQLMWTNNFNPGYAIDEFNGLLVTNQSSVVHLLVDYFMVPKKASLSGSDDLLMERAPRISAIKFLATTFQWMNSERDEANFDRFEKLYDVTYKEDIRLDLQNQAPRMYRPVRRNNGYTSNRRTDVSGYISRGGNGF